jgi:protein tyrosine/serine phosphatase
MKTMGNPGPWRRRIAIWIGAGAVALALLPATAPHINNNFHTLVEGQAYRSAQPSPLEIRSYFAEHKIATILNLRGSNPGSSWYDGELSTARELGIAHIDFGMSARRELTPQQVLQLVSIMKGAPKPLLIHCKAGADRTGLASALYLAEIAGQDEAASESQLSLRYGHYAIPLIGTWEMDLTWEAAEPFIGFPKS